MTQGPLPAEQNQTGQADPAASPDGPLPPSPFPPRPSPQWYPAGPPPAQFPSDRSSPDQLPLAQYPPPSASVDPATQIPAAQFRDERFPAAAYPAVPTAASPAPAQRRRARRRRWPAVAGMLLAVVSLAVAAVAGAAMFAALSRKPTAAQKTAAAAAAIARRWQTWPADRIFPATLGYSTSLLTREKASRIGISRTSSCAGAVTPAAGPELRRDGCQAGLRANYLDQLQGVVYTIGILAFPDARHAASFSARLSARGPRFRALRPLALPGTASARFRPAAAQRATARRGGPFVILTIAGYADGEPRGRQKRPSIFAPASQLAAQIARPLTAPATVNCASPEWSC